MDNETMEKQPHLSRTKNRQRCLLPILSILRTYRHLRERNDHLNIMLDKHLLDYYANFLYLFTHLFLHTDIA